MIFLSSNIVVKIDCLVMIRDWITAMRLRTLPLAIASISMGGFLAYFKDSFKGQIFLFCLITTLLLQILSNLANDYGDAVHGADSKNREGPSRAVQSGTLSKSSMKRAITIFAMLSLGSGLYLLHVSQLSTTTYLIFLGLGIMAIIAAILYTNGKLPYGYKGLGDVSVFIFFGIVTVMGTFFLQSKSFDWDLLLPASSIGFFTVGVLNVNNIRDIKSDLAAGKKSIAGRLGRKKAVLYHSLLLTAGIGMTFLFVLLNYSHPIQFIILLVIPFLFTNLKAVSNEENALILDPYLKQLSLTTLFFVFLFGVSILMI